MPSERYVIPPAGPSLPLLAWSTIVTQSVRDRIPDVLAARAGRAIVWRHHGRTATLTTDGMTWWAQFADTTIGAGPELGRIFISIGTTTTRRARLPKRSSDISDGRYSTPTVSGSRRWIGSTFWSTAWSLRRRGSGAQTGKGARRSSLPPAASPCGSTRCRFAMSTRCKSLGWPTT
jgi:hypothetical protein